MTNTASEYIAHVIHVGDFPPDFPEEFKRHFVDTEAGAIARQESTVWDFKEQWPSSFSDDYFGGLLRLVCAFSNSFGGVIFFGVHDKTRKSGQSTSEPNIEALNSFVREWLSEPPICRLCAINLPMTGGSVFALLVPRKRPNSLPTRTRKTIGKYPGGKLWIRHGHEVLEAGPEHLGLLYGNPLAGMDDAQNVVPASPLHPKLPPSPATIKQFIGRMDAFDRLFKWLLESDEPRSFLYGKGGSGKTTIAYEFARFLSRTAGQIDVYGGRVIDQVLFLSAKNRRLNTESLQVEPDRGLDFTNASELFQYILLLTGRVDDQISSMSDVEVRAALKALFDDQCLLIVIDDIDTLTTAKVDPGMDFLYRTLSKSAGYSKVLYTLRNLPTQSIESAIEVKGLEPGREMNAFIEACCRQFKVPVPEQSLVDKALSEISERRPLILEAIIGLRRSCGTYPKAVELFRAEAGDNPRNYVFMREWNELPPDNRARSVLVALAMMNRELGFEDIVNITSLPDEAVRDAIARVSDMFLTQVHLSSETKFKLDPLTRQFVLQEATTFPHAEVLKARAGVYSKHYLPKSHAFARAEAKIERLVLAGNAGQAWKELTKSDLPVELTEDPRFRALKGYVATTLNPPKLQEARDSFDYCARMRLEPDISYLRNLFEAEKLVNYERALSVCEKVISGKTYDAEEVAEFWYRKAATHFRRAQSLADLNPTDAGKHFAEAARSHLKSYFINVKCNSPRQWSSAEYASKTCFRYFTFCVSTGHVDEFFDFWKQFETDGHYYLDPAVDAIKQFFARVSRSVPTRSYRKFAGRVRQLRGLFRGLRNSFLDEDSFASAERCLGDAEQRWSKV